MRHVITKEDEDFIELVEDCSFPVDDFDHKAHLRLAYIYIIKEGNVRSVVNRVRNTLNALLIHAGIEPSAKYHETLTEAWVLAVMHFMEQTTYTKSSEDFISQNPCILDSKIMLTHYSTDLLFSDTAKTDFVEPDLEPIPRY